MWLGLSAPLERLRFIIRCLFAYFPSALSLLKTLQRNTSCCVCFFLCLFTQASSRFARCNVIQSGSIKQACVTIFLTLLPLSTRLQNKKAPTYLSELCDPAGTRTQGPYIKSVLLYQLSYGI